MSRDLVSDERVIVVTDNREAADIWKQYRVKTIAQSKFIRVGAQSIAVKEHGKVVVWWNRNMALQAVMDYNAAFRHQAESGTIVLNRYASYWKSGSMRERLKLWGLPVAEWATWADELPPNSGRHYVRTICFWVNGCRIVAAAQSINPPQGAPLYHPLDDWSKPPYRRLARLALRAAYAVGWDIASVTLRCTSSSAEEGVTELPAGVLDEPQLGDVIVHIDPVPQRMPAWVRERYAAVWQEESIEQVQIQDRSSGIKLGMDVELILYDTRTAKIISAARYLPKSGAAGCDAVRLKGRILFPLMELRPEPAERPAQLVEHVRMAVQLAENIIKGKRSSSMQIPNLVWLGGSCPRGRFSLGGHIHVSGVALTSDLIRALDTYVAFPLSFIEQPSGSRKRRPGYGTYGDVREHDHGGAGGFEYRTLPCFIFTPALTLEILTLFYSVVVCYPRLTRRDSVRQDVIQAFLYAHAAEKDIQYAGAGKLPMRQLAIELLDELLCEAVKSKNERRTDDSKGVQCEVEKSIQSLRNRICAKWTWDENEDLRNAWLLDIQ
ncbi:putative amidoligase domain-containing protein [Paenibacillus alvei]|uniref:putative amidoligase domain-containing protein n=1 Tax=Paenibacillus alvei TaxID=44250 RepID=UPI0018CF5476|nr:hypothetical protein [Paenibacillus alvei]MCY9582704.1 hypothetical protein [Paenibacillus alvei]MCY9587950.1 hypothetical protein [Paenibacillus alvei]